MLPKKIYAYIAQNWAQEAPRRILWSPVCLMLGIAAYFSLTEEPPLWLGAACLLAAVALYFPMKRLHLRIPAWAMILMALGFSACQLRAWQAQTPLLAEQLPYRMVSGIIDEIEPAEKKVKLVLSHLEIEGLAPQDTPRRIRISFRKVDSGWQAGDRLLFEATLYPLPSPNMPGGYDFARYFYFRSIGGIGYAIRDAQLLESATRSDIGAWLHNIRHHIGEDMRVGMPGAVGAVAAAMTVGETGPIPEEVKVDLRDAGLAHMLSISGLHLSIVTGVVFFCMRLLLALFPPLALRLPVKGIAACFALAAALIYLTLAAYPVPAQRAVIMVCFLFTAMLLGRRVISVRSLSFAACIILLIMPESMYGASFQLSFAATLAIVALYESAGHLLHTPGSSRVRREIIGITATSLVATFATASFIIYQFNRVAVFGLIANMVVIPLSTVVIMPGMVLAVLLMPLGLQHIGYVPFGLGTGWMLAMAHWVTSLPYAQLQLPSPTWWGLLLSTFGLLWLCLMRLRWRWFGIAFMLAGLSTILLSKPYDLLISDDGGKVLLRRENGKFVFLRGTSRSFDGASWLRFHAQMDAPSAKQAELSGCTSQSCSITAYGKTIAVARKAGAWQALCASAPDILITQEKADCPAARLVIDAGYVARHGAVGIRFTAAGMQLEFAGLHDARPWHRASAPVAEGD